MDQKRLEELNTQWRAANYLGAAQLYLKTNVLLREPLRPDDIKPRLLGHWGTQPGLNLVYSHLNRLIQDTDASVMLVVGPGHGAPGILAELWIDGSLGEFYPDMGRDMGGITRLVHQFSWPGGFPSHLTALAPGAINEGGELGYSLLHAFGAAFDNPELIVACIVGDGEAETGGLAASWFSNRFLNPASDGAVLPILHLNGIKLSGPSIMGRMSDEELEELFTGYGYEPRFVEGDDPLPVHQALWEAMDWAYQRIREIQAAVRESPTWPMIILKTLKGWTGPKELDGQPIEGTERSHQIPILDPADNPEHLRALEAWLTSYRPEELFDSSGKPAAEVTAVCPSGDKRMGMVPQANGGQLLVPLELPDLADYAVEVPEPGSVKAESTRELGKFLRDVFSRNRTNFRMVSPDETTSNRLDDVFEATDRVFMWPIKETDQHMSHQGKVMEALNEQMCEGWLEGYLLTGRHGLFPCYEAFVPIVDSMVGQYAKWLKIAREVPWRKPVASLNYLLTSHAWRQDHNGYSHQSPSFINTLLSKKNNVVRIYLPPDTNCLLTVFAHCLESRDYVNCVISSKQPMPQWLSIEEAREHCARGASCW
ncbi:MAG TPA: phosphoketolase family protein, partial [Armatimonadota bacterium]|nr:phosphoketolase family protein [Armatimonadota bacterium]